MSLLKLEGVTLERGGRLLAEGIDIELGEGEGLVLIGPNGCGKSSLIRLVAGLLAPTTGTIERAEAALVDNGLALDRELTLGKALLFWGGHLIADTMNSLGIAHLADVPVRFLSTGQMQRARLARAMASGARLWLLDEPLNGLDRDGLERLNKAIHAHRAAGGAVLAASHHPLAGDWKTMAMGT